MKYLKTINELFDTEELKSEFEIPLLTGELDVDDLAKNTMEFNNPENSYVVNKLMDKFPFLEYCMEDGDRFGIKTDDKHENIIHFYFKENTRIVTFTIVVYKNNDYDAVVLSMEGEQDIFNQEYSDCDLHTLFEIVESVLVDQLVDNGFGDIMSKSVNAKSWSDN